MVTLARLAHYRWRVGASCCRPNDYHQRGLVHSVRTKGGVLMLQVTLFGRFCALSSYRPMAGLDARKVQELFCYLLLYRDRPHPREALATLLWSESPAFQAKKGLRQTLW